MNTRAAIWTDATTDRVKPASTSLDPSAESVRMLGLAIVGSATVACLIGLVS